ncbi:MAG: hypothetical protein SVX43_15760, partial [Cyanobacteriota bacterium]|nr:hypothetical protein [Cyanobacteriota bacterium]
MTLQIKILNNMMGNWVKKYLPREGVWKWVTGPSGEGEAITVKDELLDPKELLDIINWRFSPGRKVQMTAVFGDPDFLPFSFLHKGIVCGSAVCRLVRWYGGCSETDATSDPNSQQEAALNRLIEEIKEQNDFRKRNGFNPFTQQELAEILLIDPDRVEAFFQGCETPLDALQPQKLKPLLPFVIGTGFLVGKNYLLTNHHVLENPDHLSEIRCQFGYERDLFGRLTLPVQYEIDLSFWMTNSALDYTLVRLKRHSSLG